MPKQDAKICWEYWECKPDVRENCPAFKTGEPCWRVATQYCGRVSAKSGFEKCITCEWYRLNHPPRVRRTNNYGL